LAASIRSSKKYVKFMQATTTTYGLETTEKASIAAVAHKATTPKNKSICPHFVTLMKFLD
jgi:hypothetical protein